MIVTIITITSALKLTTDQPMKMNTKHTYNNVVETSTRVITLSETTSL